MLQRDLQRVVVAGKDRALSVEVAVPQVEAQCVDIDVARIGQPGADGRLVHVEFTDQVACLAAHIGRRKNGARQKLAFHGEVVSRRSSEP